MAAAFAPCAELVGVAGLVITFMLVPGTGSGQTHEPAESKSISADAVHDPDLGGSLQVSLVTVGPGPSVSSHFGHGFLRVRDATGAYDRTYSFGRSGLDGPMALASLIQGRLPAGGGMAEAGALLRHYEGEGRSIWIQELELDARQQGALTRFLERGRGVGNPYDFFSSNCTTPLRDAIDFALGGHLRAVSEGESPTTFRARVAGYTSSDPILSTLFDFLMSDVGDRTISEWEDMSIPGALRERLREVTVTDATGRLVPLVRRETVHEGWLPAQHSAPRSQPWFGHLMVGLALGAVFAWLGAVSAARPAARYGFAILGGAWTLVVGLGGLVLVALWAFSNQMVMLGNENLFQANPLVLLLGVVTWGSVVDHRHARALAVVTAGIAVIGLLLKVLPAFDQANGAIIALLLPAHVGLAWGIWRRGSGLRDSLCFPDSPAN